MRVGYGAHDLDRHIDVAIKVLQESLATDIVFMRRLWNKARALHELTHPDVVRFWDFERQGPLGFLVMKFIEGDTLRGHIFDRQAPLSRLRTRWPSYDVGQPM